MYFNEFNDSYIQHNNFFILYSNSNYHINKTLDLFKKKISMPELNVSTISENSLTSGNDLINLCETLPIMSDKRLIILKSDFLGENSKDKFKIVDTLQKYIKNINKTTLLVLYFYQLDKRENINKNKKVKKLLLQNGLLVVNNNNNSIENKEIVERFIRKHNISLPNDIVNHIISNSTNSDMLINDMNKLLCLNTSILKNLNIKNINEIFSSLDTNDIFDLSEAINSQNKSLSLKILNSIIDKGVQPMSIVFNLINNYKKIFYCKINNNLNQQEISKKLKLHPYVVKLMSKEANKYSLERLAQILEQLLLLQISIKTKRIDSKLQLENLILTL